MLINGFLFAGLLLVSVQSQQVKLGLGAADPSCAISFSKDWQVLGPFQIGTREAVWGSDPLQARGGFHNLTYGPDRYPSSLAPNASVGWTSTSARVECLEDGAISVDWNVKHDCIDWQFMQLVYGWSALQYSTWIRGTIHNHQASPQRISLKMSGVLEYRLNQRHFFGGDFYGFHRSPTVVTVLPGSNVIDIRLVRDVRAMGGTGLSTLSASMSASLSHSEVVTLNSGIMIPQIFNGKLSSRHFGVVIQNLLSSSILLVNCHGQHEDSDFRLSDDTTIKLVAGQSRPLALQISEKLRRNITEPTTLRIQLCYSLLDHLTQWPAEISVEFNITDAEENGTHRFTYLHPSKVVNYAIIQPPKTVHANKSSTSILLELHGAGVEADSELVRHSLDLIEDLSAIALFPTGMSAWSGDDWHTWGMTDVLASISALEEWGENVDWPHVVDTERVLVSGHSNGGQGTWFIATHMPDLILAATPLSGYSSIENYVPYSLWSASEQQRLLETARLDFKNELFLENLAELPVLQQHGSADDNVPPFHSRLMSAMRAQLGYDSKYIEVPGKEHYWEGVAATQALQEFYRQHFTTTSRDTKFPLQFECVVAESNNFGSRHGFVVDQLRSHDRLGRLRVKSDDKDPTVLHIETTNIHRFHFDQPAGLSVPPSCAHIDNSPICVSLLHDSLMIHRNGSWLASDNEWRNSSNRYGRQRGSLDAILNTRAPFQIFDERGYNSQLALQISQNMLQYFGAASDIRDGKDYDQAVRGDGNLITLIKADCTQISWPSDFPIRINTKTIVLLMKDQSAKMIQHGPGHGAIFLRPLPDERVELVVWGHDEEGLQQAARLIPTLTGAGQPDFVVLSRRAKWIGAGGALAIGFFDHDWSISSASFL